MTAPGWLRRSWGWFLLAGSILLGWVAYLRRPGPRALPDPVDRPREAAHDAEQLARREQLEALEAGIRQEAERAKADPLQLRLDRRARALGFRPPGGG